jgi:translocation and assembly module TamB
MKRPLWKRLLRAFLVIIVGPILLGSCLLLFLVRTEGGTRWLFQRVGLLMKGAVTVDSLKGTLKSPLEITGLHYKTATMTVDIKTVRLKWRLGALVRRQLDIESFSAEGVRAVLVPEKDNKNKQLTDIHFPVNIVIRQATIRDIVLSTEDSKSPLVIDSIDLATSAIGDKVHVDRLAVVSELLNLNVEGDVTPLGGYPVSLRTALTFRRGGMPPFEAKGSFSGSLEKLGVDQVLSLPFDAHLRAELTNPLSDLAVDGTLEFAGLKPQQLDASWPEANLHGRIHLKGPPEDLAVDGTVGSVGSSTGPLGPLDAEFRMVKRADEIRIAALKLSVPGTRTSFSGEGLVVLGKPAMRLDLRGAWNELRWPLSGPGQPLAVSRRGDFSLRGTLDDYAVALKADLEGSQIPPGAWSLEGRGNLERMRISSFQGTVLGGALGGSAEVGWKPQVTWRVSVKGDELDPSLKWAGWPGRLGFDAQTTGRLEKAGPSAHVAVANVRGSVRDQKLGGGAILDLEGEQIQIRQLDLTAGGARATAQGEIGRRNALTWSLAAPNLGAVVEGAGGALRASGHLDGPKKAVRIRATLEGESLALNARTVARLKGAFDVDLAPSGALVADIQATGVKLGERSVDTLTLTGRGTRARHDLTLTAVSKGTDRNPGESVDVRLSGGWTGSDWRGELTRLDLSSRDLGSWKLQAPAPLEASPEAFTLSGFCWASSGGRVCADGAWRKSGPWSVHSTITDLPLGLFKNEFPADVKITGALNGRVDARADAAGVVTATVNLVPGPGEIRYGAPALAFSFRDVTLDFHAGPAGAEGRFAALLPETGTISGEIVLPQFNAKGVPQEGQAVRGRLVVELKSLAFLQAFSSQVAGVKGTASANLIFGGTMAAPTVLGNAALQGGQADVPEYGLQLRELTAKASGDGKGPLKIEGSVRSGEGKLSLAGQTPLIPGAAEKTSLSIQGERFQVMNTPEGRVLVSPKVQVVVTAEKIDVSGDVEVPVARIEYERKFATVSLSRDIVFVGATAPVPEKKRAIVARVRLILGDEVKLKTSGFDAKISGSLLAFDQPGKETAGTGELEIKDGTYKAYGQDLTIERGRLFFSGGPIDNPGVDAKAFRKAKDGVVAGILIKGSLRTPEVTVYSDPPMAQADALAYLLLGHPLGQATQQEGSLVTSAAASLGIKGGNLLAKKLAARFGLEEVKIETEGTYKEAALVVGKYLSPKFYVSYGIGLFDRASTLRMNYILNRRWTVKAETGDANGADIVYTIER